METPDEGARSHLNYQAGTCSLQLYKAKLNTSCLALCEIYPPNPQNVKTCLLFNVFIYFFLFSLPSFPFTPSAFFLFLPPPALKSVPFTARSAKRSSHMFYDSVFGEEVTDAIPNLLFAPSVSKLFFLSMFIVNRKQFSLNFLFPIVVIFSCKCN